MSCERRLPACCLAGLVWGLASLAGAQEPELTVAIADGEVKIGDPVRVTVAVELDEEKLSPTFPNWQRHWGSAEIRELGEVVKEASPNGTFRHSQTLILTSFRPGSVSLPPVRVSIAGPDRELEVSSAPAAFEVGSVLPPGDEELEPKPPTPPRPVGVGAAFWWTGGLLAGVAAVLVILLLLRRRVRTAREAPPVDPWTALDEALTRLAAAADPETVFTGLSLELRRFLGRCLAFPAAESTTTELRRRLVASGLPRSVAGDVVRLLTEADGVKFAQRQPPAGRLTECLEQTRHAATEVRAFLEPAQPSEEEAAA